MGSVKGVCSKVEETEQPGICPVPLPPGFSEHQLFSGPCFREDASVRGVRTAAIFTHG